MQKSIKRLRKALKGVESSKDVENQRKVYKNGKRYRSAQDLYNKQ